MDQSPSWLKVMEHGSLGEARARAFLMNRFWVLERSVDVHGADYLVQRRLLGQSLLDMQPPRLGIVQVKFVQDGRTTIEVPTAYVVDKSGHPHNEFFVLVYSGKEDDEREFLLGAGDVVGLFRAPKGDEDKTYKLTASKLLETGAYRIVSRKSALDRIDEALKNADLLKNQTFLRGSRYVEVVKDHLDVDLKLPLENFYGNIADVFHKDKKKLQHMLFDMHDAIESLNKILVSTDPLVAYQIFEDELSQFVGGSGYSDALVFSYKDVFDEDHLTSVKEHKRKLSLLRKHSIDQEYLNALGEVKAQARQWIVGQGLPPPSGVARMVVWFDPHTLQNLKIRIDWTNKSPKRLPVARKTKAKALVVYFRPSELFNCSFVLSKEKSLSNEQLLETRLWMITKPFEKALDRRFLGETFF